MKPETRHVLTRIAKNLKRMRRELDLSQEQLDDLSGVGVKTISSYETLARIESMKVAHIVAIAEVFRATLDELVAEPSDDDASAFVHVACTGCEIEAAGAYGYGRHTCGKLGRFA